MMTIGVLAGLFGLLWHPLMPLPYSTQAVVPVHPSLQAMMTDNQGQSLTEIKTRKALVVIPSHLPTWARQEFFRRFKNLASHQEVMWNGNSSFFRKAWGWHITGLYPVHVREVVPRPGVSAVLLEAIARSQGLWNRQPWRWNGTGFGVPTKTVAVTLSLSLIKTLNPVIPPGGSVAVLDGQGEVLGQSANPMGRDLSWQPHPLGRSLTPVVLALALTHPQLFSGLSPQQGADVMYLIATRWGSHGIQNALRELGMGQSITAAGQGVQNPPLPKITPSVLANGAHLWGTIDEVARAYLLLVDGYVPKVTWRPIIHSKVRSKVAVPAAITAKIDQVLPQEVIGTIHFDIWRPGNSEAIAYTRSDHGLVVVMEGSAAQQTVAIVQQAAQWLMDSRHSPHSPRGK